MFCLKIVFSPYSSITSNFPTRRQSDVELLLSTHLIQPFEHFVHLFQNTFNIWILFWIIFGIKGTQILISQEGPG